MFISINYDSKWSNSFLGDKDSKGKRPYLGTKEAMNKEGGVNYRERHISLSTVYGIIYRLLGARAPLEELLENDESFVSKLIKDGSISFEDKISSNTEEVVYLRHSKKIQDKSGWFGTPDNTMFELPSIIKACSALLFTREQALDYILNDTWIDIEVPDLCAVTASELLEARGDKEMKIAEDEIEAVNKVVNKLFKVDCSIKAKLNWIAINKAMLEFAEVPEELLEQLAGTGTFAGVSLNGNSFTSKDLMGRFAEKKMTFGGPYKPNFWVLNEETGKKVEHTKALNKTSGVLEITIDCDLETAEKMEAAIEAAGVTPFYVGKKGLGYVNELVV